jgi:hypothetical protein
MAIYTGSCHCGDLTIEYNTALEPAEWPLRECQCSFCRKHAMLSTSDPNGEVVLFVHNVSSLKRYRFATGVTDFLICARCGVYVGATVMNDGWTVLNARTMDCASDLVARPAEPRVYDQQSADERIDRRIRLWSRCRIESPRARDR